MIPICPRQRRDHRVRRPGDGPGPAAEVSEFAGNADLCQRPDAVRAASEQARHRQGAICGHGGGLLRLRPGYQAGVQNVVASSGTALTPAQARLLKRFASKVVLNFDPDSAGQGAAAKSSELLVAEGFQVNVAMLPAGEDPDTFIRRQGGAAYQERAAAVAPVSGLSAGPRGAGRRPRRDEDRREFLGRMLTVAARIPEAAARDQFADRLAHKARITEEVVRAEIRKAAVQRETRGRAPARPVARPGETVRTRPDLGAGARSGGRVRRRWPSLGMHRFVAAWRPDRSSNRRDPCRDGPQRAYHRPYWSV